MRTASQSLLFDITFKSITIIIAQTAAFRFLFSEMDANVVSGRNENNIL